MVAHLSAHSCTAHCSQGSLLVKPETYSIKSFTLSMLHKAG